MSFHCVVNHLFVSIFRVRTTGCVTMSPFYLDNFVTSCRRSVVRTLLMKSLALLWSSSMPNTHHYAIPRFSTCRTTKGAFEFVRQRAAVEVGVPYFPVRAIYALAYDDRNGRRRLWAASKAPTGLYLSSSDYFGTT